MSPHELMAALNSRVMQVRSGILLVPPQELRRGAEIAVRLEADVVDLVARVRRSVPAGARSIGLTGDGLLGHLDGIANETYRSWTILVTNFDILLAGLGEAEREYVWRYLFSTLRKRQTGLLLLMPDGADHLLTPSQREQWSDAGRLASLEILAAL